MPYLDVDHGEVTMVIEYDFFEAHVQKEIRSPTVGVQGPLAVLFPLSWSLCGPVFETSHRSRSIFCISRDDQLHRQVETFIEMESPGAHPWQSHKLTPEEESRLDGSRIDLTRQRPFRSWVTLSRRRSHPPQTMNKLPTNFLAI